MTAYIVRRLLLVIPTLFGIMLLNFAVVQIVPGGPVEQMIAKITGTAIESTARFSGSDEGETLRSFDNTSTDNIDSKYTDHRSPETEQQLWCLFYFLVLLIILTILI